MRSLFRPLKRRLAQHVTPLIHLFLLTRSRTLLSVIRRILNIQITVDQLLLICETLWKIESPKFLVFGVGNDSVFWQKICPTAPVFIEDDSDWIAKVKARNPSLSVVQVSYTSRLGEWQETLTSPERLHLNVPSAIRENRWDVILVDAPRGYHENHPGRMQSIALASQVVREHGSIFVHDCHRTVERASCDSILKPQNRKATVGTLELYSPSSS